MGHRRQATDKWQNPLMPISVKGIVLENDKLWLRKNEWQKWELPGGRPDANEQPEETVVREELGLEVGVDKLVDTYIWRKDFGVNPQICIVTFACNALRPVGEVEHHGEAGLAEFQQFSVEEALQLNDLPDVYKRAIQKYSS